MKIEALRAVPLFRALDDEAANELCELLTMRDVTQRKRLSDELRRHRDHLEELVGERTAALRAANEQLRERIAERGRKIETLEFEDTAPAPEIEHRNGAAPSPLPSPQRGDVLEQRRSGGARVIRQPDLLAKEP